MIFTKLFNKFFNPVRKLEKIAKEINALEPELQKLPDVQLKEESEKLKGKENILPRAFALAREAAKRTLGQRHFDVQLIGGIVLHEGKIAEMVTGEGKTLAATAPVYLNALAGKGVHVVTVNDYLAKRDTVWMGQIYDALGLKVACIVHEGAYLYDSKYRPENPRSEIRNPKQISNPNEQNAKRDETRDVLGSFKVEESFLRPIGRKEAYQVDITYGTNHEFGFDYLRDNLAHSKEGQVQRGHHYAIIDEVDSILIDEARTPLIISAPDAESSQYYKTFSRIVSGMEKGIDYEIDEKLRSVTITSNGIDKVEKKLGGIDLYAQDNLRLNHYLQETLKAYGLFQRDKDYVVKDGQVIIVDQFTGRMMLGRRYSAGLHQAIEAKEGVVVQNESRTYAQISIQNYFRMYEKLAGMTGTAQTSAEEFDKVYKLEVVSIPTHNPLIRKDLPDAIYKTREAKYRAIAKEIKRLNGLEQPVLIGTVSIENNEELSQLLNREGIKHEILNAKNHEREGAIIAQAGKLMAVTVATNMAGRGVDIVLGGNPPSSEEAQKIRKTGGLHVIGTERHESRRIDNQLRGRSGRQGDQGSSQFYLSLEDDVLRIFGGDRIQKLMTTLKVPEDEPISAGLVSKAVEQAQGKIEGFNFDARKHLLDYDDVLNKQRAAIYRKRQQMLEESKNPQALSVLDMLWMNHLENIEALMDAVRIRAYGQHDPLIEFRREAHILYQQLLAGFDEWQTENERSLRESVSVIASDSEAISKEKAGEHSHPLPAHLEQIQNSELEIKNSQPKVGLPTEASAKVGRNDPCSCGSGKKYKRCHGA